MTSTKQIRLSDPLHIKNRIKEFLGKKINVVLADRRVIIGELNQVNSNGIDLINMRLKNMHYSFDELSEIYFDVIV
jgi:hypothetical protein